MTARPEPSPADIRAAHIRAAEMVELLGEPALPIFLRLESEVARLDAQEGALARARAVARGCGRPSGASSARAPSPAHPALPDRAQHLRKTQHR
ncbi:hypothetical protein ACSSV4_000629 [Roseovarius sp. MBR-154]